MLQVNDIKTIKENIKTYLNSPSDLVLRDIKIGKNKKALLVYLYTIVDIVQLNQYIIEPLLNLEEISNPNDLINELKDDVIVFGQIEIIEKFDMVIENILKGSAVLLVEGETQSLTMSVQKFAKRSISEPPTSQTLNGPRDGFNESFVTNMSLIRVRIKNKDLIFEDFSVGKYSTTKVVVCYIKSIASPKVVKKIKERIQKIDIDGLIDSSYVASYLEEKNNSIFKQSGSSEKPDIISSKILEGRIAIIVDGSPVVITLPFLAIENFQAPDDYFTNSANAMLRRFIRLIAVLFAVVVPSIYVAVQVYHYKVIPLRLLLTLAYNTQNIPMSPILESLFVVVLFEILHESGLRMPKFLGVAISIVGGIIIGDMTVEAGLVSPPTLIVIALSGLTIYTVPDFAPQLFVIRIVFLLMGAMLGLLGVALASYFLVSYLANFQCYDTPYLAPISPYVKKDTKDLLRRVSIKDMKTRPKSIPNINKYRRKK